MLSRILPSAKDLYRYNIVKHKLRSNDMYDNGDPSHGLNFLFA